MGRFVIVAYTPKPGKEQQLIAAVKKHLNVLHSDACEELNPVFYGRLRCDAGRP